MLTLRPRRRLGVLTGVSISAVLVGSALALIARVATETASFTSFTAGLLAAVLLILALAACYWTYGCWSLRYELDRNALVIAWAGNRCCIPLKEITGLALPSKFQGRPLAPAIPKEEAVLPKAKGSSGVRSPFRGIWWPGYRVGESDDSTLIFATGQAPTLVVTPSQTYAISPPDPLSFAEELNLRARLGPTEEIRQEATRWWPWELPAWHDRTVVALVLLGLALNLGLFASLALAMPALPDLVPVHFTPVGIVDRAASKGELFLFPAGGLALLLANAVVGLALHRVEPLAAYFSLAAGVGIQALLWDAWLRVLT